MIPASFIVTKEQYRENVPYFHRLVKDPTVAFQVYIVPPVLFWGKVAERRWCGDHIVTLTA